MKKEEQKKPKSKTRKIIEWIGTAIFMVLLLFVAACEINGMVTKKDNYNTPVYFGKYQLCLVLTNSMVPEYPVNTTILVEKQDPAKIIEDYNNGEEVNLTFFNNYFYGSEIANIDPSCTYETSPVQAVMTHQLVGYQINEDVPLGSGRYLFAVHGINTGSDNDRYPTYQYQVFSEKQLMGRVIGNSDFLGALSVFATSWWGLLILLLIPAAYLIITSVIEIFKAFKKQPEEGVVNDVDPANVVENEVEEKPQDSLASFTEEEKERLKKELLDELLNGKGGDK